MESFAETLGEYSGRLEAQSIRREGLGICTAQAGRYLALATLSTLEISKVISAISTPWPKAFNSSRPNERGKEGDLTKEQLRPQGSLQRSPEF